MREKPDDKSLLSLLSLDRDVGGHNFFEAVYRRDRKWVQNFINHHLPDRDRGSDEDVTQEVFREVLKRIGSYPQRLSIRGWLATIAKRYLKTLAHEHAQRGPELSFQNEEFAAHEVSDGGERLQEHEAVREILEQIPSPERTALILSAIDGYTHEEVARQMKLPISKVRSYLRNGKLWFRFYWNGNAVVRVFYATDRAVSHRSPKRCFYENLRSSGAALCLGTCDVSIPRRHQMGCLESPQWWRLELKQDPEKHITLVNITVDDSSTFFRLIHHKMKESKAKDVFIFVHGFNLSFDEAVRLTAQLAYDLGFKGAAILYSWPSEAKTTNYLVDQDTIDWTKPHLLQFLNDIATQSGASTIHLIAHSMGNRALLRTLKDIALSNTPTHFNEIIATAPDIDSGEFCQIADAIQCVVKRITLYASSKDAAIRVSRTIHKYPRAGEAGENILVIKGIDTIDATDVDTSLVGHSYYSDERTVISDMYYLINEGLPPDRRHGLIQKQHPNGKYWAFQK